MEEPQATPVPIVDDFKIYNVNRDTYEAFKDFTRLKCGGKYNVALDRLLEEASFFSVLLGMEGKLKELEDRIAELEGKGVVRQRTVRTMTSEIKV